MADEFTGNDIAKLFEGSTVAETRGAFAPVVGKVLSAQVASVTYHGPDGKVTTTYDPPIEMGPGDEAGAYIDHDGRPHAAVKKH